MLSPTLRLSLGLTLSQSPSPHALTTPSLLTILLLYPSLPPSSQFFFSTRPFFHVSPSPHDLSLTHSSLYTPLYVDSLTLPPLSCPLLPSLMNARSCVRLRAAGAH